MSWKYVDDLLFKLSKNSTLLGKYWVATLLLLRLVVLTVFGENVWSDEQREFSCNTKQPGCENVCFNNFAPVSNVRLWGLQILTVSLPGAFYFVYVMHVVSKRKASRGDDSAVEKGEVADKERIRSKSNATCRQLKGNWSRGAHARWKVLTDHVIPPDLRRSRAKVIWRFYLAQIFARVLLECGFVMLQFTSYQFRWTVPEVFRCSQWPCPHTVDCFVSRPNEKTVFFRYMYIVSAFSVLLSLIELCHIAWLGARRSCSSKRCHDVTTLSRVATPNSPPLPAPPNAPPNEKWGHGEAKSASHHPFTPCSNVTAYDATVASSVTRYSHSEPQHYVDMRPSNATYL